MVKKRGYGAWIIVTATVAMIVGIVMFGLLPRLLKPSTQIQLGDGIFKASVVTTEIDRAKGLSDVKTLADNKALLMIYPTASEWKVDVSSIMIPLDIVWLNQDKKIIYIVENILPDHLKYTSYKPKTAAKYVVELPGGSVKAKKININNTAMFEFDESGVQ